MAWADYLRYATGAITHYLVNVYKPQVLAHYQDHKSSSPIHARWTALHIAGKSFAQIAAEETRRNSHVGGRSVTRQAVQKAIRGFAVRTRITLPSVN